MFNNMLLLEKKILTEMLHIYKECPCLWDHNHLLYNNRQSRNEAHSLMLEKYKELYPDANIDTVRRKIDNMRTAFRREVKKRLESKERGDKILYRPSLWYFKLLFFLNPDQVNESLQSDECTTDDEECEVKELKRRLLQADGLNDMEAEYLDDNQEYQTHSYESEDESKPRIRRLSTVYVTDTVETVDSSDDHIYARKRRRTNNCVNQVEVDAYGKIISLQLKHLEPLQQTVAEKLISDIIFYAKLNKLSTNSCINNDPDK